MKVYIDVFTSPMHYWVPWQLDSQTTIIIDNCGFVWKVFVLLKLYSETTMIMLWKVEFKPNSTPQNRLVRWELLSLIYCELTLSLVDMERVEHNV